MTPFTVKDWKDYPLTTTPITAAALEDMEDRLSDYTDTGNLLERLCRPDAALGETISRTARVVSLAVLTSGTLRLGGTAVRGGEQITSLSCVSGTTALAGGSNQWFCLVDRDLNVIRKTVDDTSTAWAANALKTLALSSPWTPPADMFVYFGVLIVAATVPLLVASGQHDGPAALPPTLGGNSSLGLTNPASLGATAAAITVGQSGATFYGYWS